MAADTSFYSSEILVSPRSPQDELATEVVPAVRDSVENVTSIVPGLELCCPQMEDPRSSDNPALVQAMNKYRLARYRSQAAGAYAGNMIASMQAEFREAEAGLVKAGGKLDEH